MKFLRFYIILIYIISPFRLESKSVKSEIDSLSAKYVQGKDLVIRVKVLMSIADEYVKLDRDAVRDSIFDVAVETALLNDTLLFSTYKAYFSVDIEHLSAKTASTYSDAMLSIAHNENNNNERLYYAYSALAKAAIRKQNYENGVDNANKAYYHVSQMNNDGLKAESMLLLGFCKEASDKKIEAFRNYMDALYLAEKVGNREVIFKAYEKLAQFYFLLKKYEKAKYYRKKQLEGVLHKLPVDSFKMMEINVQLTHIMYRNNEFEQAKKYAFNLINFSKRNDCDYLKNQVFGLHRTYLIDNGLFAELRDFYEKQYPDEYERLSKDNPNLYYRLSSYIFEANGKPDSAQYFYQLVADNMHAKGGGGIQQANFYKRYGEFFLRRNNLGAAIQKFDSAYKFALDANYFPYLIEVSHYLDSLNYLQKNVGKAYEFAVLNKKYTELQASVNKGEEMLQLEVENEARQQELKAEMDRKETEREHNIQYTFMVVAIIGVFILLTILGSFKVHPGMIRALGFFSFIFFFEFIIMLADHRIHDFTHGEPWKFMAFKIVLIAGLLPLHHWLEEKVIHYLVHHKLLDASKISLKLPSFKKAKVKPVEVEEKPSDN